MKQDTNVKSVSVIFSIFDVLLGFTVPSKEVLFSWHTTARVES
jgi:hypothetical protein